MGLLSPPFLFSRHPKVPVSPLVAAHQTNLATLRFAFICVVIAPLLFLAVGAYLLWNHTVDEAERDLRWRAEITEENIGGTVQANVTLIRRAEQLVSGLSAAEISAKQPALHKAFSDLLVGVPQSRALFVLDAEGTPLVWTLHSSVPHISVPDRDYFISAKTSGNNDFIVSDRLQGILDTKVDFINIVRRRNTPTGEFAGVVGVTLSIKNFDLGFLENHLIAGADGFAIGLVKGNGVLLARTPPLAHYPSDGKPSFAQSIMSAATTGGLFRVVPSADGKKRRGVLRRVRRFGSTAQTSLYVYVSIPETTLVQRWLDDLTPHFIFGLPATATMVAMMILCLRRAHAAHAEARRRHEIEQGVATDRRTKAIGQLAGGVAHDFNNALNIILGQAEAAIADSHRADTAFRTILSIGQRSSRMVAHLLSFAQQNVACPVVVDLATELPRIATRVADIIGDMLTLEVIIDEAKTSYCVEIDVDEFDMAMLNLILNARDALPHGGEITLALGAAESPSTIQSPHGAIGLSVRDAGAGMKPEVVQRAFEPFFTTKDVGRGSGLGLSQVLGFARQSGGHVSIVSAPGSGTSVTIILPRCPLGTKPTAAVEDEPPNGRKNETTSRRRSTS